MPVGPAGKPWLLALSSQRMQLAGPCRHLPREPCQGQQLLSPPQAAGPLLWLLGARGALHAEGGHQADRGAAARGHQPGAQ